MSPSPLAVRTRSADETTRLGRCIGDVVRPGEVLLLIGDLGTGKTTFVQGLAQALGAAQHPTSPTFVMIHHYEDGSLPLIHADLYRCSSSDEVASLGLEELCEPPAVCVVEWGEKAMSVVGDHYLELDFSWDGADDDTRTIRFVPVGRWQERMGDVSDVVQRWSRGGDR